MARTKLDESMLTILGAAIPFARQLFNELFTDEALLEGLAAFFPEEQPPHYYHARRRWYRMRSN